MPHWKLVEMVYDDVLPTQAVQVQGGELGGLGGGVVVQAAFVKYSRRRISNCTAPESSGATK